VSHYWEMGGSIWGGVAVAVYDGHNGIMAFWNESLRAEKHSSGEQLLYRFVCMKPINRSFDHLLDDGCAVLWTDNEKQGSHMAVELRRLL